MPILSAIAAASNKAFGQSLAQRYDVIDPYYNYVTTHLTGNGTDAAQNNTFLDSSTNNFTITRNGNTTQGSFSPYGSLWSVYFGGSTSDNLSIGASSNLNMGTGDFTFSAWIHPLTGGNGLYQLIASNNSSWQSGATNITWSDYLQAGKINFGNYDFNGGGASIVESPDGSVPTNKWTHVCITRSGDTFTLYINGVSVSTNTFSGTVNFNSNSGTNIGHAPWDASYWSKGYLSNLKVVKGYAVAPSGSPTTPDTNTTGTQLLACQSNRFIDNSSNNFTITTTGIPQITRFSPLAPTLSTQYSTSTIGGSGYFDGDGDYLNVVNSDTSKFAFGTGDFTVELWYYPTTVSSGVRTFFDLRPPSADSVSPCLYMYNGELRVLSNASDVIYGETLTSNKWYHLALVRNSGSLKLYVNGVQSGSTYSDSYDYVSATNRPLIFANTWNYTANNPTGYCSGYRVVKGTAVYTTTFTPPTTPLTAISGTQLLLNYTNGAIYDNAMMSTIETAGNAQISTSVKKYGTGSLSFDGTGDYITLTPNTSTTLAPNTGDFTIEFWTYLNSSASAFFYDGRTANDAVNNITIYTNSSSQIIFGAPNSAAAITGPVLSASMWYHIAVCKSGNKTKLFVNGNQAGTYSDTNNYSLLNQAYIGYYRDINSYYLNGYIDDFRITRGYARYWENFIAPTEAFPTYGKGKVLPATTDPQFNYTTLLLSGNGTNGAQNNTFLDSSTNSFTITRNGNTTQGSFSPYGSIWSSYFDHSGDYLEVANNDALKFGSSDFTIEGWFFADISESDLAARNYPLFSLGRYDNGILMRLQPAGGTDSLYFNGNQYDWTPEKTFARNQWNHVALVRSSGDFKVFVNGQQVLSNSYSSAINPTQALNIGRSVHNTGELWQGYISNFRIVKGTALYSNNFTPSSTPLTAVSGTSLLTCQSNRRIDNSSNNFTVSAPDGIPVIAKFGPFAPTAAYSASTVGGSGYFDGTGDYLTTSSSQVIPTGSFTIEAWVYTTNANSTNKYIVAQGSSGDSGRTGLGIESSAWWFQIGNDYVNSGTPDLNQWNYVAMTYDGSTIRGYVNGISQGSISHTGNAQNTTLSIGTNWNGNVWNGYISSLRISNTVRTVTSVPTSPFSNDVNTTFLTNFTNAGIIDLTGSRNIETVGDAQISSTQYKFNSTSIKFDGTGDYLKIPASNQFVFGTRDFTIEGWVYLTTDNLVGTAGYRVFEVGGDGTGYADIQLWRNDTPILYFYIGTTSRLSLGSGTIPYAGWHHFALTRVSDVFRFYLNGVLKSSSTTAKNLTTSNNLYIGYSATNEYPFNGYLQDFRITNGYGRYVQNFTPPTTAFKDK